MTTDDRDHLVTVAVFASPTEAALARNRLESIGIKAFLGEENSTSLGWALTGAQGGIKLEVAWLDAETARDFLEDKPWLEPSEAEQTGIVSPQTLAKAPARAGEDKVEGRLTFREKQASRAFKSAIFGYIVPPLLAYAIYLLLGVVFSGERLEGRPRWHAFLAVLFLLPIGVALTLIAGYVIFPAKPRGPSLRDGAHDPVLVGRWRGTLTVGGRDLQIDLDLRADGKLHYQSAGAETLEFFGSWAFEEFTLFVQFDRVVQGADPLHGQVGGWRMLEFNRNAMVLDDPRGKLTLLRQD